MCGVGLGEATLAVAAEMLHFAGNTRDKLPYGRRSAPPCTATKHTNYTILYKRCLLKRGNAGAAAGEHCQPRCCIRRSTRYKL